MTRRPILSQRLDAIADLVPAPARCVADIGYDRGHLIHALLATRPDLSAIGVERQPGAAARVTDEQPDLASDGALGDRVRWLTGDGLEPLLGRSDVEGACIAGIGSPSTAGILRRGAAVLGRMHFVIICCPRFEAEVRPALASLGWAPDAERIVVCRGRYYEVIRARPHPAGPRALGDDVQALFGPTLFAERDPLLVPYLEDVRRRLSSALTAQLASYGPASPKAALGHKLRHLEGALDLARSLDLIA